MLDALRSVAGVFGKKLDPTVPHEPDPGLLKIAKPVVGTLRKYFRAEVCGMEHMPEGAALIVGNHNAGITFFEPFFLGEEWLYRTGEKEYIYSMAHDVMVALPAVGNILVRLGAVQASQKNADRVFAMNKKVMVFPGGNYEAFRPYSQRFCVDFGGKTGFARLAIRNQVPVVPTLCLGGHETFFVLHRGEALAKLIGVKKYLRSESFPLFLGLPWGVGVGPIFHLPLPSKLLIEVGEPVPTTDYAREDADDPEAVKTFALQIQQRVQDMMDKRAKGRRWLS